nr:PadR family transcriptional regulator [Paenibacillus agilis]
MYGYSLSKEVKKRSHNSFEIQEGTLYLSFKRLEKNGYVTSHTCTFCRMIGQTDIEINRVKSGSVNDDTMKWYTNSVAFVIMKKAMSG